jgi:hypothetical protein
MPTKKIVNDEKKEKVASAIKKGPTLSPKKENEFQEDKIPNEIIEDPNISPIFDVVFYRELFMSLRQKLDDLYDKREKSEKSSNDYDDAVYNITTKATTDAGAQDFLSYCYKKGKYDFCLTNYEKYMKWSFLAAAQGNAFTLSKLQIFLTNSIDDVLSMDNHDVMIDFLELTSENYYVFLSKLVCEENVKNLGISAESLIKMPEVYQEQTDDMLRLFDNAKMDAAKSVKEILKKAIDQLVQVMEQQEQKEKDKNAQLKTKFEEQDKEEKIQEELKQNAKVVPEEKGERSQAFKKSPGIKKFRY